MGHAFFAAYGSTLLGHIETDAVDTKDELITEVTLRPHHTPVLHSFTGLPWVCGLGSIRSFMLVNCSPWCCFSVQCRCPEPYGDRALLASCTQIRIAKPTSMINIHVSSQHGTSNLNSDHWGPPERADLYVH